jgi:hypothetical protein
MGEIPPIRQDRTPTVDQRLPRTIHGNGQQINHAQVNKGSPMRERLMGRFHLHWLTGIPFAGNSIIVNGELTLFGPTHPFGLPLPFNSQFFGEI